jgi:hypothetical protein
MKIGINTIDFDHEILQKRFPKTQLITENKNDFQKTSIGYKNIHRLLTFQCE